MKTMLGWISVGISVLNIILALDKVELYSDV